METKKIASNYNKIREQLPENVLLIAVSKTRTIEEVGEAVYAGCKDFGENKAQELCTKYEHYPNVNWHFIGTLQKNKLKYLVGKACLIHSVDSLDLALETEKRAKALGIVQNILIQVNPANEPQKRGISIDGAEELYKEILEKCPHVCVKGIMEIAPEAEDPEDVRMYLRQANDIKTKLGLESLSMGMSHDYKVAVEEGSTMVRIGSAIFGERIYNIV